MLNFFRRKRKGLLGTGATRKPASPARPNGLLSGRVGRYLLYAAGEVLLVMIGILLALQVNNWNEWRKDRVTEKELLYDILSNIERNSEIMKSGLNKLEDFNNSSDIILNVLTNKPPYNDSLDQHFFASFRTAGLLFPISKEGYESMKNAGFDIISSERVKNNILQLYEVCYQSLGKKAAWSMTYSSKLSRLDLFKARSGDAYIPIDYNNVLEDEILYSQLVEVKENYRNFLKEDVVLCLSQNIELVDLIKDELK